MKTLCEPHRATTPPHGAERSDLLVIAALMFRSKSKLRPPGRRRWARRALIGVNVAVGLCVLAAGLAYAYVRYRFNQIPRAACVECVPADGGGSAMTVLLVGSDSREGLSPAERQA